MTGNPLQLSLKVSISVSERGNAHFMGKRYCTECGWSMDSPTIDPDCQKCFKRHRRLHFKGLSSDYPATMAYRDAMGSNCPCGTYHLDLNMSCKACQYRHYWWYMQGYDFSLWVSFREQREDAPCMECPTADESIPTPSCLACYERIVNSNKFSTSRHVFREMLDYADGGGATTNVCNVCCAPEALFSPGCNACFKSHQYVLDTGKVVTPLAMKQVWARISALNSEVFLTDGVAPIEVDATPYRPQHRKPILCKECGADADSFTKGCESCQKRHTRKWLRGIPTPYADYLDYQHLIEQVHVKCGHVATDGRVCPAPLSLFMRGCPACRKRWENRPKSQASNRAQVYPSPEHALLFTWKYWNVIEAQAWAKIEHFPKPPNN
jgi:hypothetical protein